MSGEQTLLPPIPFKLLQCNSEEHVRSLVSNSELRLVILMSFI